LSCKFERYAYDAYRNELYQIIEQNEYGTKINLIGEGRYNEDCGAEIVELYNVDNPTMIKYMLSNIPHIEDEAQALKELYPSGFNTTEMTSCCIIAAKNNRVDHWNQLVQDMNPNDTGQLHSKDTLGEVDDPHGVLANMMTEDVLNKFGDNGIPPHT
jgi:hypothetical protein